MEKTVGEQWLKLCDEHEAARTAYFDAFKAVNAKFVAVGAGTSLTNPTEDELGKFRSTWLAWEEVKARMDSFVKAYA